MEDAESSTKPKEPTRKLTPTGFPEPWHAERPKHGLLYRFLGLETIHSIVTWRPKKLPGPRMSAFVVVTAGIVGGCLYDRIQAKRLKQSYIDQVRWLSEVPINWEDEQENRIEVYASKLPEDVEPDRPIIYFKKYVKPILNAAGYDYSFTQGQIPGSIARVLLAKFKLNRLEEAASITPPEKQKDKTPSGIVLVGRNTLKEYLWALKKGYIDELDLDRESRIAYGDLEEIESQEIARKVDKDGLFPAFVPTEEEPATSQFLVESPTLPTQPPILVLPFTHPLGSMFYWPKKWASWLFGERGRVERGGQAAFTILANQTRDIQPPSSHNSEGIYKEEQEVARVWIKEDGKIAYPPGNAIWKARQTGSEDLDADLGSERYISSNFKKTPVSIQNSKKWYYEELQKKLATARQLANGEIEPTESQRADPPPTEADLHEERTRKEKTWKREDQGFRMIRPGSGMTWHEAFQSALRVYVPVTQPPPKPVTHTEF